MYLFYTIKKIKKASIKKYKPIIAFFIAMVMASSVFVTANTSDYTISSPTTERYTFEMDEDSISLTMAVGSYKITSTDQGDEIYVEEFGRLLIPGKPNLPSKIFSIAIPPGAEVEKVTIDAGEAMIIPGIFEVPSTPLESYPPSIGEFVRTAGYRKYNLVDVRITPLTYNPVSGCLVYYPFVTIDIQYSIPDDFTYDDVISDSLEKTEIMAEKIILNYQEATTWYTEETPRSTNDFVIITLDSLTSSVTPLENWEAAKGRNVEVVTTSWINSNYAGYDLAER